MSGRPSRARSVSIGDTEVRFASLEDRVIHKIVSGRPRDMEDVKNVLVKNPGYVREYILTWLQEFDTALDTSLTEAFAELSG
jgi:predicted nucleotidyltransferase